MSEAGQMIILIGVLIVVFILTRRVHAWREKRAYLAIIEDLKVKQAFDPASAVDLPYAQKSALQMGLRQYRPKVLQYLVLSKVVERTDDGRYYLCNKGFNLDRS